MADDGFETGLPAWVYKLIIIASIAKALRSTSTGGTGRYADMRQGRSLFGNQKKFNAKIAKDAKKRQRESRPAIFHVTTAGIVMGKGRM